jgi:hypothetical protein
VLYQSEGDGNLGAYNAERGGQRTIPVALRNHQGIGSAVDHCDRQATGHLARYTILKIPSPLRKSASTGARQTVRELLAEHHPQPEAERTCSGLIVPLDWVLEPRLR